MLLLDKNAIIPVSDSYAFLHISVLLMINGAFAPTKQTSIENIRENGECARMKQMLNFPLCHRKHFGKCIICSYKENIHWKYNGNWLNCSYELILHFTLCHWKYNGKWSICSYEEWSYWKHNCKWRVCSYKANAQFSSMSMKT